MSDYNLNLSTRPFPAYRLINLLVGECPRDAGGAYCLAGIRIHALFRACRRHSRQREQTRASKSEALGRRLAELEADLNRPEAAAKLSEIEFLNDLIARKSF